MTMENLEPESLRQFFIKAHESFLLIHTYRYVSATRNIHDLKDYNIYTEISHEMTKAFLTFVQNCVLVRFHH